MQFPAFVPPQGKDQSRSNYNTEEEWQAAKAKQVRHQTKGPPVDSGSRKLPNVLHILAALGEGWLAPLTPGDSCGIRGRVQHFTTSLRRMHVRSHV